MRPRWRKTIAVLEIVGGACGSTTVAYGLTQRAHTSADIGLVVVLTAVYFLALFAGVMLWRDTRAGRVASIVAQFIQLPKVLSPHVAFMVSYGLDVAPMAVSSPGPAGYGLVFNARLLSHQILLIDAGWLPTGFGVSIVSLLALRLLLRPMVTGPATLGPTQPERPSQVYVSEHPEWVPSFGCLLVGGVVLVVVTACAGVPLLLR